jgi:hypothetical protein
MDGMPQFMRQGGDIARFAIEIDQHPGSQGRQNAHAESPAALAMPGGGVNMLLIENLISQAAHAGGQILERVKHKIAG